MQAVSVRLIALALGLVAAGCAGQDGATPEIYFCPADGCADRVIEHIDTAEQTVVAAVYTFTHYGIADALARAVQRGAKAWVVVEASQSANTEIEVYLRARGVGVRVDGNPQLMHDKFVVVDERTVGTGSFNYTQQADTQNNENLVFFDSADAAALYFDEFQRLWAAGDDGQER